VLALVLLRAAREKLPPRVWDRMEGGDEVATNDGLKLRSVGLDVKRWVFKVGVQVVKVGVQGEAFNFNAPYERLLLS
jgi:hypothetical protein